MTTSTRSITEAEKIAMNEMASDEGRPLPFCDATNQYGEACLRPSTGLTDYCRKHEERPETNWSVNDQCAHENWEGHRCTRRVAFLGDLCTQHQSCTCDACSWT